MLPGFAQNAANAGPGLPSDPREIFAAAAPFYDFNSPELKPWHLKATYQLYDEKGKPSEQGTYEYWWASPQVYRSTWTRPGATHTEWYTADGNSAHQETGERLGFFEEKLNSDFVSPLSPTDTLKPSAAILKQAMIGADLKIISSGDVKIPCILTTPLTTQPVKSHPTPLGTYCFDPQTPILRFTYSFGSVITQFDHIVKVQNKYLAKDVQVIYGERKLLSAQVDSMTTLSPSDPALTPSPDATVVKLNRQLNNKAGKIVTTSGVMAGMLVNKTAPVYPPGAKFANTSGTVILQGTIGKDGKIYDLRVIVSPSSLLSASALEAVSHWEYKPYLLNGEPVDVETTVNVTFTLGR